MKTNRELKETIVDLTVQIQKKNQEIEKLKQRLKQGETTNVNA